MRFEPCMSGGSISRDPNIMMLGREVKIPAELKSGVTGDVDGNMVTSYGEYVNWLRDRMQVALILKKVNDVNYLIRFREGTDRVVHHDKLKKYEGENKPIWLTKAFQDYRKN